MDRKIERILSIYSRIANGEVINKEEEAARFAVNRRSIQRDLVDIRAYLAADPENVSKLVCDRRKKGYVLLKPNSGSLPHGGDPHPR